MTNPVPMELEFAIEELLPDMEACKIYPRNPREAIVRYFTRDKTQYSTSQGFIIKDAKSTLWPVASNHYHHIDVDQMMRPIRHAASDSERFKEKAIAAVAKNDSDEQLLKQLLKLPDKSYPDLFGRLKAQWQDESSLNAGDDYQEIDIFHIMLRSKPKTDLWGYIKDTAYLDAWKYVLSGQYCAEGPLAIEELPKQFFDDVYKIGLNEHIMFAENVPVAKNKRGELDVVYPEDIRLTEKYFRMEVFDDWLCPDTITVFKLAEVNETKDELTLFWRHDTLKERFGEKSSFPSWETARSFCKGIGSTEEETKLDTDRATSMARFKVAKELLERRNHIQRGDVYELREAFVRYDSRNYSNCKIVVDTRKASEIVGRYDMSEL